MWKNIDSAPRDGTPILVYEPGWEAPNGQRFSGHGVVLVEWRGSIENFPGARTFYGWTFPYSDQDECGGAMTLDNPTHWMPLPSPPDEKDSVNVE